MNTKTVVIVGIVLILVIVGAVFLMNSKNNQTPEEQAAIDEAAQGEMVSENEALAPDADTDIGELYTEE